MRERADYDATFKATKALIDEKFVAVEKMILRMKELTFRMR